MWFKEEVRNPAPDTNPTYIRFGIGINPRKPNQLDILLPKKFKNALRDEKTIGDEETYNQLLSQLYGKYHGKWKPMAERNLSKKYWPQN